MRLQSHSPHAWPTTTLLPANEIPLGSVLLTATFLKPDFSQSGQLYPVRFRADPDVWTCDKQITKLVYPGIVFLQLFLQPKRPRQQGALIAHLRQWPFQLDGASDLVPRWCLSSLITVCWQGKQQLVSLNRVLSSVRTQLTVLLKAKNWGAEVSVLFTWFLHLDSDRNVSHQDQRYIRK